MKQDKRVFFTRILARVQLRKIQGTCKNVKNSYKIVDKGEEKDDTKSRAEQSRAEQSRGLKDNLKFNSSVKASTAFYAELREKLPEFFTKDSFDENGLLVEAGSFDLEKFKRNLEENQIEELTSGYRLDFIGKNIARKQSGERPTTVIVPDKEHNEKAENQNSKNLFFTGDNLEVLRHLQQNYDKSIDVIYIDPPYNTGSDGFVYPDNFEYSDEALQNMFNLNGEELQRLKSIQGKATHSAWLTFMYPRLYLAKKLLKDTGVIFVSIDDNEQANLKLLMDEVFGEGSYVGSIIHQRAKGGGQAKFIVKGHDIVHVYGKNIRFLQPLTKPKVVQGKIIVKDDIEYIKNDDIYRKQFGKYEKGTERRLYYEDALEVKGQRIKNEIDDRLAKGEIFLEERENGKHIMYNLTPISEATSKFYSIIKVLSEEGKNRLEELGLAEYFSYPKPVNLIKELILSRINKDIVVLDFFAGSSTTADAVMQLNAEDGGKRQFIMCTLPEPTYSVNSDGTKVPTKGGEAAYKAGYQSIDQISRARIEKAAEKIKAEHPEQAQGLDLGFQHYQVVSPKQETLEKLEFDEDLQLALFDDMLPQFSSDSLGVAGGASGFDTLFKTYLVSDGYKFDVPLEMIDFAGIELPYVNQQRLYLISSDWRTENTKSLVNQIGTNQLGAQTLVIYGHAIDMASLRELEIACDQLEKKVNLLVRY